MTAPVFFIALEPDSACACRVRGGEVEVHAFAWEEDEGTGTDQADAIAKALATLDYEGEVIVLGLSSREVYAAEVGSESLPRKGRHAALLFRLEEHLPLDAERLTADFLPPVGGRTLGVAAETEPVRALLDHLAEAGVRVEAVCPTALLALWRMIDGVEEASDFVFVGAPDCVDIFRMAENRPLAWYTVGRDPEEVSRTVHAGLLIHPADPESEISLAASPLPPELLEAVTDETGLVCRRVAEESSMVLAARAAPALLGGDGAGWVNLARGALASADPLGRLRRPVQAAVALALALLVAVIGGTWWRAARYKDEVERLTGEQRAIFARLYPNREVPVSVRRWLASEAARLTGLSGTGEAVPEQPPALETLRRMATGLPDDLRFRLVMIRVEPTEVYIEGQARSHADAETVAKGIAGQGFEMEPPRTESLAKGGVAFTLVGQPAAAEAASEAKGPRS